METKTNQEIKELYEHSSIVHHVKGLRLRWLRPITSMPEYSRRKRVLEEGEGEKRKRKDRRNDCYKRQR